MRGALAFAHFIAGHYEEAIAVARAAILQRPGFVFPACVAAVCAAFAGHSSEAVRFRDQVRVIAPYLTAAIARDMMPFRRPADQDRWIEGLRLAGVLE
jgi:hypothetical protein